jgi:hypothetical protein
VNIELVSRIPSKYRLYRFSSKDSTLLSIHPETLPMFSIPKHGEGQINITTEEAEEMIKDLQDFIDQKSIEE